LIRGFYAKRGRSGISLRPLAPPHVPWTLSLASREDYPPAASSRENPGQHGSWGDTCALGNVLPPLASPTQPAGHNAQRAAHPLQTRGRVALLPPQRRYSGGNQAGRGRARDDAVRCYAPYAPLLPHWYPCLLPARPAALTTGHCY